MKFRALLIWAITPIIFEDELNEPLNLKVESNLNFFSFQRS